jgi:hypothetical protein
VCTQRSPAKTIGCHAHALEIRKLDSPSVSDDHVFDIALAIDEHADLTLVSMRQFVNCRANSGVTI